MNKKQNVRNELFIKVCADGFTDVAEFMLNAGGIDLNYHNKDNCSALWYAVHNKRIALAKFLLRQRGIHLDTLNLAIEEVHQQGCTELMQEILDYPNVLSDSPREQTADLIRCCNGLHGFNFDVLTAAIKLGNTALAEKIIDAADIYIDVNADFTPLVSAIESGHISLVRKLLDNPGIDINSCGLSELPPLLSAVKSPEIVRLLLQKPELNKRRKDCKGNTALILAVKENMLETVMLLITDGDIDINVVNKDASSFLTEESRQNLLDPYGNTDTASTDRTFGVLPLVGKRIAKGEYSKFGLTALQTAIALGYSDIALYLLENTSAKISTPFPGNVPLLFVAITNKMDAVVKVLLQRLTTDELNIAFSESNNRRSKITALHVAFRVRSLKIFQMLLQYPVNVNRGDKYPKAENALKNTILGEILRIHNHKENVYEYLAALMKRSDLDLHICPYLPDDNRSVFQILSEEKSDLLQYRPDDFNYEQNGSNGYECHC